MKNNYPIAMNKEDVVIFDQIISALPYTIYAYGSRVKNQEKKFSDIDICIKEDISDLDMFDIKQLFADSNLPMKVDVKKMSNMSVDFLNLIKDDLVLIKTGDNND